VFIFQNNDNPVGGPHRATADAVVKVQLVPPGHDVRFAKQPSQGGVAAILDLVQFPERCGRIAQRSGAARQVVSNCPRPEQQAQIT